MRERQRAGRFTRAGEEGRERRDDEGEESGEQLKRFFRDIYSVPICGFTAESKSEVKEFRYVFFESDYIAGAHPQIMKRLAETNLECLSGYGTDKYCESAREKIRAACRCEHAEVEFLVGGTQANAVIISTMLRDCEGVIAAKRGM